MKLKSTFLALFFNGDINHIINPWVLELNLEEQTLTLSKRNWFYIGKDKNIIAFRFIRNIKINEKLFGADIYIKAISGNVSGKNFSKKEIRKLKEKIIEYNNQKNKRHIIFS